MPVTVKHDITDDENTRLLKGWNMYLHSRKINKLTITKYNNTAAVRN